MEALNINDMRIHHINKDLFFILGNQIQLNMFSD